MKPLIVVVYDGIHHSIFAGQVLQPLLDILKQHPSQQIIIVSFEKQKLTHMQIDTYIPPHKNIRVIITHKIPFFGGVSLWYAARQLKRILKKYTCYTLRARSALAGWICLEALNKDSCAHLTIQARGLLAEEYRYAHHTNFSWWHSFRSHQYKAIERTVYGSQHTMITIEAVSPALKKYLVETFNARAHHITIAQRDIPSIIPAQQCTQWKQHIRAQLHIPHSAHVYCYNGSAKPWQCPEKSLEFFIEKYRNNNASYLLILTGDVSVFEKLLEQTTLPTSSYTVVCVQHDKIYQYLAACDTGLIFRENHIVNWVSRPTKILEYRAVGLEIIHNNTIAYLNK